MNHLPRPHRTECEALPKGWIREEIPRVASGISNNRKPEVNYLSPMGKRIRSKNELLKILGQHYDLATFDFDTGKLNPLLRSKHGSKNGGGHASSGGGGRDRDGVGAPSQGKGMNNGKAGSHCQYDPIRALRADVALVPPIRQTASIFKQPVTVFKSHRAEDPKAETPSLKGKDDKQSKHDKGRQLFWEKRLSGLRASYPDEEYLPFNLPENLKPVGPGVGDDIVLASISTNLHLSGSALYGQKAAKGLQDDPFAYINPEQPLVTKTVVMKEDLEKLEARVNSTRAKLAKALHELIE